jgi:peroxiredoxin Q/BCP
MARKTLKPGEIAPVFQVTLDDGSVLDASTILGHQPMILYFYPKDETYGCTREACAFRDSWEIFSHAGIYVLGVSADPPSLHTRFRQNHSLPFRLASDPEGHLRALYGVDGGWLPRRITFAIGPDGRIRSVFESQIDIRGHIESAKKALLLTSGPEGS